LDQQLRRKLKSAPPQRFSFEKQNISNFYIDSVIRSMPADIQLGKVRTKLTTAEEECASLRRQLEHYKRIADDMPRMRAETSTVRGKFENQREAAIQMQSKIARLEAANLELNLKIDDLASARQKDDVSLNKTIKLKGF
jgi:phage-related tail protein